MKSVVKILLFLFMFALVVTGLSVYWTFFKLVPSPDRSVSLQGLGSEAVIRWDDNMVPHIMAGNENDAFKVMGYLHARDRLWQMTQYQYKLEGLHSREIDESLLKLDIFYLTMPFSDLARQGYTMLSDRERQLLESYASGVNEYIAKNRRHLPIEFTLSGARPVNWEPWHSLGVQMLWEWRHHHAFWSKLALTPIHELRDETITRALIGSQIPHSELFGNDVPVVYPDLYNELVNDFIAFTEPVFPERILSAGTGFALSTMSPNAMSVVSVTRDLPLTLPDPGYELALQIGDNLSIGITVPGFPVMLYGQNNQVAWAIQPAALDDGDFFYGKLFDTPFEKPVDWKRDAAVYDKLNSDITLSRHMLEMKSGAEYQVVSRRMAGHPIVAVSESGNAFLAFEWAGFRPPNDFGAYLDMAYAGSLSDMEQAVQRFQSTAIQVIATDRSGVSGRWFGGRTLSRAQPLKIRNHEDETEQINVSALLPKHIESSGQPVYFLEALPALAPGDDNISIFNPPWDRSMRIRDLLESASPDELASGVAYQLDNDTYSNYAAALTPDIIRILEVELEASLMEGAYDTLIGITLPYLQNWNYEYRSNETAATVFELFLVKAAGHLYDVFIGDMSYRLLLSTPQIPIAAVTNLLLNEEDWSDSHPLKRNEWIVQSMRDAISGLISQYGGEPHDWQWGSVIESRFNSPFHAATLDQTISARLADRNLYQPGDFQITGSSHTIHSSHISYRHPFKLTSTTTLKRTMFLAPEQRVYTVISTGQSGNIFSSHFDDQFHLWKYGNKNIRTRDDISGLNASHTQHFTPELP